MECQDLDVNSRWPPVWERAVHLAVADGVFDSVFLCCFSPLDVLEKNEIWDVIESVSEGFFTYSIKSMISSKTSHGKKSPYRHHQRQPGEQ